MGPHLCVFCDQPVDAEARGHGKLVVHHVDENHFNDDVRNLAPAHSRCHSRHHHLGDPPRGSWAPGHVKSEAHRRAIGEALRGKRKPKTSESLRGLPHPSNQPKIKCSECSLTSTPGAVGRHQKASGHRGTERL